MKTLLAICILSIGLAASTLGQVAKQGVIEKAEPTEFQSPMVIDTVFGPAIPTPMWVNDDWTPQEPKRWKSGEFTLPEYHALGRFSCDGVPIRQNYSKRHDTWESGLTMRVRPKAGNKTEVRITTQLENNGYVHDKIITLHLEVLNGTERIGDATITTKSSTSWKHSTNDFDGEATIVVPTASLRADPPPTLRITMTTKDY